MRSRGIRLAYVIVIVYSSLAAFLFIRAMDDMGPLGATDLMFVSGERPDVPSDETVEMVERVASEQGVNVVRFVEDLHDAAGVRHLYLAVGDADAPSGTWLDDGYPSFSQDVRTEIHPLGERAALDPRGYYFTFGDTEATAVLADAFREQGYLVETRTYFAPASILGWLVAQPLGLSALVTTLLVAVLVAASVLTNLRGYAIQRLHGASFGRILLRDVRRSATPLAAALFVVGAADAVLLGVYNGGVQWRAFALAMAVVAGALLVVAVVAHVVALALVTARPVLESLKGKLPATAVTVAVYLVRVPALVVAVTAVVAAAVAVGQAAAHGETREEWRAAGESVHLRFSTSLTQEEVDELAVPAGEWLRDAEASGEMLLSAPLTIDWAAGLPGRRDTLLVNDNYLQHQVLHDENGHRIDRAPEGSVLVLVPSTLSEHADAVAESVAEWIAGSPGASAQPPTVRTVVLAAGQDLFTYGAATRPNDPPTLHDAVAVVVNASTGALSPDDYTSYATQQGVVLTDPDRARAGLRAAGAEGLVTTYQPVALTAAQEHAALVNDARVHAFNVVAVLAVLLGTAVAAALVSTRKNAQAIFAKHICGWSFLRTHRGLVSAETVLALSVVLWSVWTTTIALATPSTAGMSAGALTPADLYLGAWQPVVLAGVVVVNLATLVVALTVLSRRLVRTRSSEA